MPSINRYAQPARLPEAQPFFELPFNEIAGAISARQQRYDVMTESLAKTQAEAAAIKAMPGADTEYVAKIQNKLKELETNYIDQDLAGPAGTDLLREIRKTALDPNITKIGQSYEGWRNYLTGVDKLKQEGKYDPALDDNSWKTWNTAGSGKVYTGLAEAWDPEDLKKYADNMPGTEVFLDENGSTVNRITDFDVRNRAMEVGQNFLDEADGRKWVKVDRSRANGDEVSTLYPSKTLDELSDSERASEIVYRSIKEFVGQTVDSKGRVSSGKGSGSGSAKIVDSYNLFGVGSEGAAIEAVSGYGFNQASVQQAINTYSSNANYKESSKGIRELFVANGLQDLSKGTDKRMTIPNTTLDKFEFYWAETPDGERVVKWRTGDVDTGPSVIDFNGEKVNEVDLVEKMLKNSTSLLKTANLGIQLDRKKASDGQELIKAVNNRAKVDPNYRPSKEEITEFNENYRHNVAEVLFYKDNTYPIPNVIDLQEENLLKQEWLAFAKGKLANNISSSDMPTDEQLFKYLSAGYSNQDLVEAMSVGMPISTESGINPDLVERTNLTGLMTEFTKEYQKKKIWSDPNLTNDTERLNELEKIDRKLAEGENKAQETIKDPRFKEVSKSWKEFTQEQALMALPVYGFGTATEGRNAQGAIETQLNQMIKGKQISLYNTLNNEYVPYTQDRKVVGTKEPFADGKFSVVGWRPDASKTSNGHVILLQYNDKEGNSDGNMYEIRNFYGLSSYLRHDPELADDVDFMEKASKLNNDLASNNNFKAKLQLEPELPALDVYRLQAPVVDAQGNTIHPKGGFKMIGLDGTPHYADNEEVLFRKYVENVGSDIRSIQSLAMAEQYAKSDNVVPNYDGPSKGQIIPDSDIERYVTTAMQTSTVSEPGSLTTGLIKDVIKTESSGDKNAVNKKSGAMGAGQILPSTAANPGMGVPPLIYPFRAQENIRFTTDYLRALSQRYNGDTALILAGYSGGTTEADKLMRSNKDLSVLSATERGRAALEYLRKFQNEYEYSLNLNFR